MADHIELAAYRDESRLLDEGGRIDATAIRRLQLPPERDRWIIRAQAS